MLQQKSENLPVHLRPQAQVMEMIIARAETKKTDLPMTDGIPSLYLKIGIENYERPLSIN